MGYAININTARDSVSKMAGVFARIATENEAGEKIVTQESIDQFQNNYGAEAGSVLTKVHNYAQARYQTDSPTLKGVFRSLATGMKMIARTAKLEGKTYILSNKEKTDLATTWQTMVDFFVDARTRDVDDYFVSPKPIDGKIMAQTMSEWAVGLPVEYMLGSEGSSSIEKTFYMPMAKGTAMDPSAVISFLGYPANQVGRVEDAGDAMATLDRDINAYSDAAEIAKWNSLKNYMSDNLSDLKVIVVGEDGDDSSWVGEDGYTNAEHPVIICGRASDGSVVGFETKIVWT